MGPTFGGRSVGELVLETFVGPKPKGMKCIHLDGDLENNRLDNLVWGPKDDALDISICDEGSIKLTDNSPGVIC